MCDESSCFRSECYNQKCSKIYGFMKNNFILRNSQQGAEENDEDEEKSITRLRTNGLDMFRHLLALGQDKITCRPG